MDEGWTRYVFDDLGIPYTTLHNDDFKAERKGQEGSTSGPTTTSSSSPTRTADIIKTGKIDPASEWARISRRNFRPNTRAGSKKKAWMP